MMQWSGVLPCHEIPGLLLQFRNPKNQSASLTYAGFWQIQTKKKNCEFITLIPEFTSEINTQYSPTIVMKKDTREKNKTKLS